MPGTFRQLEIFALACERGSVSAAADALDISQAAASRQIKALEVAMGQSLFDRKPGRRNRPSAAGQSILAHAQGAMRERRSMAHVLGRCPRTFRVGADQIIYNLMFVPERAALSTAIEPDSLELLVVETEADIHAQLHALDLDLLYFTAGPDEPVPADACPISVTHNELYAAPALIGSLAPSDPLPVVIPAPSRRVRAGLAKIIEQRLRRAYVTVAGDVAPSASMELVATGVGAGLISRRRVAPLVAAGLLQSVEAFDGPVEVTRYQVARQDLNAAGRQLADKLALAIQSWPR